MYYLALLADEKNATEWAPDSPEFAVAVARHQAFTERAGSAIVGGGALYPSTEAATIRNEGGRALITDGPFAETAEVIGGFYVLEGPDLDEVLNVARHIPEAIIELWPMFEWMPVTDQKGCWMALLREPVAAAVAPGTPQWTRGWPSTRSSVASPGPRCMVAEPVSAGLRDDDPRPRRRTSAHRRPLRRDHRGRERSVRARSRRPGERDRVVGEDPGVAERCIELRQIVDFAE